MRTPKHASSTYKMLYLLNILSKEDCTKKEIIKKFAQSNYKISESSITQYIKQLLEHEVQIKIIKQNGENVYHIDKIGTELNLTKQEYRALSDAKKLLFLEKNYKIIRSTIRMFYKLAYFIKNLEERKDFINFGYYSNINWYLVKQLEHHCNKKSVLTLDYVLPRGGNKILTMHVDRIDIGEYSERLYLHGIFENCSKFSKLPIDRIYMIKNVQRMQKPFDIICEALSYKITKDLFDTIEIDDQEVVSKIENDVVTIKRPNDDNFYIVQRLFSFCPDLLYVSPGETKKRFVEKLQILWGNYDESLDF